MTTRNSPVAVVSSRGAQRLREGKVWVYRSDTVELPERPGLYPVLDVRERTLGWALVNAASEISVRLLTRGEESADEQLITARLDAALAYRSSLKLSADAHRLVHAEADGLPGLVVDRYGDVLVVQNGTAALEPYLGVIVDALVRRLQPRGVLARHEGRVRTLEGLESGTYTLYGEVPDKLTVHEPSARGEVKYLVDPYRGRRPVRFSISAKTACCSVSTLV